MIKNKTGSLIVDIAGIVLSDEDRDIICHPSVGGVIFFSRNYESRQQMSELCANIRSLVQKPFLLMVDQEGGRVQRFQNGMTKLPAMGSLGKIYDVDASKAKLMTKQIGYLLALELLSLGIDYSLTPVLDRNYNQSVIGNRSFHASTTVIVELAIALIAGMKDAGMSAVGKHFPGHGYVQQDSHVDHPIDHRSFQEIDETDALPFKTLIHNGLTAIMPAHIVFDQVDDQAVGFSARWLKEILRKQYGFQGVIISDDLSMQAATTYHNPAIRVHAAKQAGCDLVLLCNDRQAVIKVLETCSVEILQCDIERYNKMLAQKNCLGIDCHKQKNWKEAESLISDVF